LVGYFHAAPSFARLLHLEPGRDVVPEEADRELALRWVVGCFMGACTDDGCWDHTVPPPPLPQLSPW
jgi:hypothetical protein